MVLSISAVELEPDQARSSQTKTGNSFENLPIPQLQSRQVRRVPSFFAVGEWHRGALIEN